MTNKKFQQLDRLFTTDMSSFGNSLKELTADELDRYIETQETDNIAEYTEKYYPKLLVQALWAGCIKVNRDDPEASEFRSGVFAQIPSNFNPHAKLKL